jgi:hypothetical protein
MEPEITPPAPAARTKTVMVTASRTIDFPSLDWGINEGDTRELPSDPEAQKIILGSKFIKLTK